VFYRHAFQEVYYLEASRFVYRVEYWPPIDLADVDIDRVIKILVFLECKLESARASAVNLAIVAKLSNLP
jgi:hypothetical protein